MYLNAPVPRIECFVREEFLYNLERDPGKFVPATIIGIASIAGRALGFHALLENGAMIWRLPVHALAHRPGAEPRALHDLQLWDCFSYRVAVTEFDYLTESRAVALLPHGTFPGRYVFTVDWFGNVDSEDAGPGGHKCAHLLELDDGNFCLQPNNRICWAEMSKVRPFLLDGEKPDYKTMTHTWKCEDGAFQTSDDDQMFYEVSDAGRS